MFFLRNADAAEAPAAAEQAVMPQVNIYEAMAKVGRITNGDEGEIPEYKVETPAEAPIEEAPVEATNVNQEVTEAAQTAEVQPKIEEVSPQPIVAEALKEVDWKEVLKKQQPKEVLTELGIDEQMANFLEFWKSGGDVKQYLQELSTDYEKMPAEELMRHQLRREYPTASERQIELLYKREIVEKYKIDPEQYDEEEVEEGKLLLDAYASKYRPQLIKEQQQKLIPPAPEKTAAPETPNESVQMLENAKSRLVGSDLYRNVLTNNSLTIGEGDEAFKFPVNGQELLQIIYEGEEFAKNLFKINESGGKVELIPDVQKQLLTAAVAKHGMQLFVEYAKHYKSVGSQKAISPIENPSPVGNQAAGSQQEEMPQTPAGMLARYGRLV